MYFSIHLIAICQTTLYISIFVFSIFNKILEKVVYKNNYLDNYSLLQHPMDQGPLDSPIPSTPCMQLVYKSIPPPTKQPQNTDNSFVCSTIIQWSTLVIQNTL